jgi:enterochelin esterase-like enzyme
MIRMRRLTLPCLILLLASGCTGEAPAAAPAATATPAPDCGLPGGTEALRIDSPEQGYAYEFRIHFPPCYDPEAAYPVLYLIPGRSSGPATWLEAGAADIADGMIRAGEVPPFLIISTGNTDFDSDARAIQNDLMPYVEQTYPVRPERRYRAVAGGSLGGIAAYRIVLSRPERYASAGIFGSGAVQDEDPRIRAWLAAVPSGARPRFFFNCGFADDYMLARAKILIAMLAEYQIPHTEVFTEGNHSYAYWSGQLSEYYLWMAEDW